MNNLENRNVSTYPEIMENYEHFFSTCKAIAPKLPVGLCVTLVEMTMYDWLKACPFSYDMLCVFNLTSIKFNQKKVLERFKGHKIMISGQNDGKNQVYGDEKYKNYIQTLKENGFCGNIWFK